MSRLTPKINVKLTVSLLLLTLILPLWVVLILALGLLYYEFYDADKNG